MKKAETKAEKRPVNLVVFVNGSRMIGEDWERRCSDIFFAKEDSKKFEAELRKKHSYLEGSNLDIRVEDIE